MSDEERQEMEYRAERDARWAPTVTDLIPPVILQDHQGRAPRCQGEDRHPGGLQRDRIQADVPLPQRALPSHCGHSEG